MASDVSPRLRRPCVAILLGPGRAGRGPDGARVSDGTVRAAAGRRAVAAAGNAAFGLQSFSLQVLHEGPDASVIQGRGTNEGDPRWGRSIGAGSRHGARA